MTIDIQQLGIFSAAFFFAGVAVWLLMHSRMQFMRQHFFQKLENFEREITKLQQLNSRNELSLQGLDTENKSLHTQLEVYKQKFIDIKNRLGESLNETNRLSLLFNQLTQENSHNLAKIAELSTLNQQQKLANIEKIQLLHQAKEEMSHQFKVLANDIFEAKDKQFSALNKQRLEGVLSPLNQQLREFKQKVEEVYVSEAKQRASLKTEIHSLRELNQQLNLEAINLTKALKGDNKVQGNWGELILERVLQQSGLRKGHEYDTQGGFRDANNKLLKPDVIIHLPQQKDIIIDSKVSLTAYERYASCQNEQQQAAYLKEHISSIGKHILALSDKNYSDLSTINCLDFVLMFIPIEPAFMVAFEANDKLFSAAFQRKVIVVTPTTLLATLKTIENLWRYEKQNQNARMIAERAGNLYDKFRGFIEDIEKLGKQLNNTQMTYHDALNKLNKGQGNLVSQAQQLLDLGVKVKKEIPNDGLSRP